MSREASIEFNISGGATNDKQRIGIRQRKCHKYRTFKLGRNKSFSYYWGNKIPSENKIQRE